MSVDIAITKKRLNVFLFELGKRYRKLSGKKTPAEIILIGGASILINYGFRDATYDADIIVTASSVMKEAINFLRDEFGLPHEWMNEGVKKTESYSHKLFEVSVFFKCYSNILTIRTIEAEYLVAMKAMSGRQNKYDLSDIVGIIMEHQKRDDPLTKDKIENAIIILYGEKKIPEISRKLLDEVFTCDNYEQLYNEIRENEKEAKELILEFNKDNPGSIKGENINNVINEMRKKKQNQKKR